MHEEFIYIKVAHDRLPQGRYHLMAISQTMLLPQNPSFAGHQTFALRSGWLKKGLDALHDSSFGSGGSIFSEDQAIVILGVGRNMVQSIRHWLLATGMAQEDRQKRTLEPTELGKAIFLGKRAWDPYLEDPATLWLLHWQLAGPGSQAFSWVWTYNEFREYEFSKQMLTESVLAAAQAYSAKAPSKETIGRDVECLLHTYVRSRAASITEEIDCPLQNLELIVPTIDMNVRFNIGPKSTLPPLIFYYALARYWECAQPHHDLLDVAELIYGAGSPGMVFKLDEDSVLAYLDSIAQYTDGALLFEDSALARRVLRAENVTIDPMAFVKAYYAG